MRLTSIVHRFFFVTWEKNHFKIIAKAVQIFKDCFYAESGRRINTFDSTKYVSIDSFLYLFMIYSNLFQ